MTPTLSICTRFVCSRLLDIQAQGYKNQKQIFGTRRDEEEERRGFSFVMKGYGVV
jgi:hypothetical protein